MNIEERISALETSNRYYKRLVATFVLVIPCVFGLGATFVDDQETIKTHRIVLTDKSGKAVAEIAGHDDGCFIGSADSNTKNLIYFGFKEDQTHFSLTHGGKISTTIIGRESRCNLSILDIDNNTVRLNLFAADPRMHRNSAAIVLNDRFGGESWSTVAR